MQRLFSITENIMAKSGFRVSFTYILLFVCGIVLIGLLLYIVPLRYGLTKEIDYSPSSKPLDNPLTGYAPWGENEEQCADSRLVYIQVLWSEWEPTEGFYDIESLEKKFHIQKWKSEGKNAVLRFICDVPGDEQHMDIPLWLFGEAHDGVYYDGDLGKGYCPDYSNEYFRERHRLAIEALAEYCNKDDFVAYVELGSLGHWGEWHTDRSSGALPLPDEEICNEYILTYSDNFNRARLLMRRNYTIAVDGGLGLYNDMMGERKSTNEWLGWIKEGGSYKTAGEELKFKPVEKFWNKAPVGGELTSSIPMEDMLGIWYSDTMETVKASHATFIGPHTPDEVQMKSEAGQNIREKLGYRFYISHLRTEYSFAERELLVHMTWNNIGLAPFFWEWPVTMYVYDKDGKLSYWETLDMDLRKLTPDESIETVAHIPFTDEFRQGYSIGIGITSPNMDKEIKLAMDGEEIDGVLILYTFEG